MNENRSKEKAKPNTVIDDKINPRIDLGIDDKIRHIQFTLYNDVGFKERCNHY